MNNAIEQDHRRVKCRIRSMLGFKSDATAGITLAGIELVHMMRKQQGIVATAKARAQTAIHRTRSITASSDKPVHIPTEILQQSQTGSTSLFSAPGSISSAMQSKGSSTNSSTSERWQHAMTSATTTSSPPSSLPQFPYGCDLMGRSPRGNNVAIA